MKRKQFLIQSSLTASGVLFLNSLPSFARNLAEETFRNDDLYAVFKNPDNSYRPYVRWWWNGNKIEKKELARELRILKEAGIGGVEINPISFPSRTDDMGIPSFEWLSDEWIDLLKFTLEEAKSLNMHCDLLLGTGFPCGAEFLEEEERSQIVVIGVRKFEGPLETEISLFDLYKEADPAITNPYSGRTMEMMTVKLVPDPMTNLSEVIDLSEQIKNNIIKIKLPKGKFALYSLVKCKGFMKVIQGTPGGMGPVLNHYNEAAVKKFMNNMSDKIQDRMGSLAPYIRSFFVDSLEIEGANWNLDMAQQFEKRRGYDLMPWLPFILLKIGGMGNTFDHNYPAAYTPEFTQSLERVRYDFEFSKAEIFQERFITTFSVWCKKNKIKSRAQAYGRSYFPLEGSFEIDIPECETWLKHGIGKDISESDFTKYPWHLGQGNTMINKIVSSAAHLKNKRLVSSEEMTNTDMVFNATFEIFKIAGDQSTISGVTQPVFHGFNYSPANAAFPGWITYGCYFNEKNNFWPYFKNYTDYRVRLSALFQQATMFADIALLAPFPDMWSKYGAQNEPFPTMVYPSWQMLVWESIHQNGSACDYVSESVIGDTTTNSGSLIYGDRKYKTLFLIDVESLEPKTAAKLLDFVSNGGRIFCIGRYPSKSLGYANSEKNDEMVKSLVEKMKSYPGKFNLLEKPESNFLGWFKELQSKYNIQPYVHIKSPEAYISQVRYQAKDAEIIFFNNSSDTHDHHLEITFSEDITKGKSAWLWDAVSGERYRLPINEGLIKISFGPATSRLIVFDKQRKGETYNDLPETGNNAIDIDSPWSVNFQHTKGTSSSKKMNSLKDLKDLPEFQNFSGTVIYNNKFEIKDSVEKHFLNLGKVFGICEVFINGKVAGVQWYGKRIYSVNKFLKKGTNEIDVKVITVMGNYMKTLKDNAVGQYWTNLKRKDQPLQSMGLVGPVTIY